MGYDSKGEGYAWEETSVDLAAQLKNAKRHDQDFRLFLLECEWIELSQYGEKRTIFGRVPGLENDQDTEQDVPEDFSFNSEHSLPPITIHPGQTFKAACALHHCCEGHRLWPSQYLRWLPLVVEQGEAFTVKTNLGRPPSRKIQ